MSSKANQWFLETYGRLPRKVRKRKKAMDSLKYKRDVVLAKLQENREKHRLAYEDAMEGFKEAVVTELSEALELAKAGKEYRLVLKQTKPAEYLKNYDRAIAMFSMSSQDEVELTENEFTQYVMDNWNWSMSFTDTARTYGKGHY